MSGRIGIELGPRVLRAVRLSPGARPRVLELAVEGAEPEVIAAEIVARLGRASGVAVALEMSLLFAKRVPLPPLPTAERERMLRLDPERFFPVRSESVVVASEDSEIVFAALEGRLVQWLEALATVGPIERVEAAPQALVRALLAAGRRDAAAVLPLQSGGYGLVVLRDGALLRARRLFDVPGALADALRDPEAADLPLLMDDGTATPAELDPTVYQPSGWPQLQALQAPWLTALGAVRGIDLRPDRGTLLPPEHAARVTARRRGRLAMAGAAAAAALAFALSSVGSARQAAVEELDRRIAALRPRAAALQAVQAELLELDAQANTLRQAAQNRVDPLRVLLGLSERLPPDAHLRTLRGSGDAWQVEGYATDAAALIPALEAAVDFEEVQFVGGTSRTRINDREYERFSLAFRLAPAPQ